MQHFLLLGSIYLPNFRKCQQTVWILPIFSIFGQFWLFFTIKDQKMIKSKKSFFCSIFFCWEAFTYGISENFIKRFGFCQLSSFLVNFGCFFWPKMPKSNNSFFVEFSFVWKHLHIKFQISLANGLDFVNYLHFCSILHFFYQKRPKNDKIEKKFFLQHFPLLGSIYLPNLRKSYQTVWILPIHFIFGQYWLFFFTKRDQKVTKSKMFIL